MRRSVLYCLLAGLIAAALVSAAHALGWLHGPENWIAGLADANAGRTSGQPWQYAVVLALALGAAWLAVAGKRQARMGWLIAAGVAELVVLTWVASLYGRSFQPLPGVLAIVLGYASGMLCLRLLSRGRPGLAAFDGRLKAEQVHQLRSGDIVFDDTPRAFESTILVCDLANKYELTESADAAAAADAMEKFTRRAAEFVLNQGAYLHAANGEGVVAVFGFPAAVEQHAEKAIRAAFDLSRDLGAATYGSNGETTQGAGVHVGISSGQMVAAAGGERSGLFLLGQPIELARRFCAANRHYGSRILIGPQTFELANEAVIARPIDFLNGANAQERHEIYEPLALSADAPSDLVARRDCFWNGVVFYREKRWAEAYAAFQQARDPQDEQDPPLTMYLRRLEPLALHLVEWPGE